MARYESRRGRPGSGRYGGDRGSRYGGGKGGYGGRRGEEDDEYYEEGGYYGKPAKGKISHEQATLIILGAIVGIILIVIIASMAGQSVGVSTSQLKQEFGYEGKKAEEYKQDEREMRASALLGDARYFDQANPYEDKEEVAAKYRAVIDQYPGTRAAAEAQQKYDEVMSRRK